MSKARQHIVRHTEHVTLLTMNTIKLCGVIVFVKNVYLFTYIVSVIIKTFYFSNPIMI